MNKSYLIFERHVHSVIYFMQASSIKEAICKYIVDQRSDDVVFLPDDSLQDEDLYYPHPLAYIEASEKVHGEWQIRELPEWVLQGSVVEAFCGESQDGPASDIAECRERFKGEFPKVRARAFVWYLKQGHLVTFYRRKNPFEIVILKRYLLKWHSGMMWNGDPGPVLSDWEGGYEEILNSLNVVPFKPRILENSR
jgi:hypothetical protein